MFFSRALLVIGACVGIALGLSSQASADDGHGQAPAAPIPPRAAPVARGFVQASYAPSLSKLIDQAVAAAADLTKASQQARAVAAQAAAVDAVLTRIGTDVEATDSVRDRKERVALAAAARLVDEQDAFTQAGVWSLPSADAHWSMPVSGGEISQPFGPTRLALEPARTFDGVAYAHFHDGVDIAAPFGTPVMATAPGQVIFAGHLADGAMVVMIAHIGGYVSEYAHLDDRTALPVRAGDIVRQGQVIGRIGLTGLTTGAHLHLQTWHGGVLADPMAFMGAPQP
jgi:murein DD-endopeptidase MepM/ murein hydrolase activator NlpD